jgi:hypothetical protein
MSTGKGSTTGSRNCFVCGVEVPLDDSVERAWIALKKLQEKSYQKELERMSDNLFNLGKKKKDAPEPVANQEYQSTGTAKPAEPTMAERLRQRRSDKVRLANQLDEDIMALDHEITWLERHPGSEYVIKEFVRKHEGESSNPIKPWSSKEYAQDYEAAQRHDR